MDPERLVVVVFKEEEVWTPLPHLDALRGLRGLFVPCWGIYTSGRATDATVVNIFWPWDQLLSLSAANDKRHRMTAALITTPQSRGAESSKDTLLEEMLISLSPLCWRRSITRSSAPCQATPPGFQWLLRAVKRLFFFSFVWHAGQVEKVFILKGSGVLSHGRGADLNTMAQPVAVAIGNLTLKFHEMISWV